MLASSVGAQAGHVQQGSCAPLSYEQPPRPAPPQMRAQMICTLRNRSPPNSLIGTKRPSLTLSPSL